MTELRKNLAILGEKQTNNTAEQNYSWNDRFLTVLLIDCHVLHRSMGFKRVLIANRGEIA